MSIPLKPAVSGASRLSNVNFHGGIDSVGGSVAVAADGISNIPAAVFLRQRVLNNPTGQLAIIGVGRTSNEQINIGFSKLIDTSTINATNFQVTDANGNPVPGVSFQYFTQAVGGGVTQGVVRILSGTAFPTPVTIRISNVRDRVGPRSALNDFNQDGVVTGNPFAPPFATITTSI